MEAPNPEWLKTPEGRAWLESEEGNAWLRSEEGRAWTHSPDGLEWLDELTQRGFDRYFSGEMGEPPEWGITPEAAPRIGDRVRIMKADTTIGGDSFEEGELAIVAELRLAPVGIVWVHLRTIDGRKLVTGTPGTFVPA